MTCIATFKVPPGAAAQVHIIDSGVRVHGMPTSLLLTPPVDHLEILPPLPSWSFLIQSSEGAKILFDLAFPDDLTSFTPAVQNIWTYPGVEVQLGKHVADILEENDTDPAEIRAVVWSHHHSDHIGDIRTFPNATELIVGPGFKEAFYPGYPTNPDSELHESYFEGRTVREIDFSGQTPLKIGAFRAVDFFGDGSFYLLDTPGHDHGHLAGLARTTTNPDTFIFMGGDLCHHGGEIRPSPYLPIPPGVSFPLPGVRPHVPACPGAAQFRELNVRRGREPDEPFFDPVLAVDLAQAIQTIKDTQVADAKSDVFFVFAHDATIQETAEFFPHPANHWKEKGWGRKSKWNFLADLALAAVSTE